MKRFLLFAFAMVLQSANAARAGQFFGPTPYLSEADSPFDLSGLGTTFFLEDFEDGELNTPGVGMGPRMRGQVKFPSADTDSVDADDGLIDGNGAGGHSFVSLGVSCNLSFPAQCFHVVRFEFDENELGFLPNTIGFAWSDGVPNSSILIEISDANDELISRYYTEPMFEGGLGDLARDGGTSEDVFFGVIEPAGIPVATIYTLSREGVDGFELDHLQYGLIVPEPSGFTHTALIAVAFAVYFPRRSLFT